jgi:1-acyl-sn-glycerol-3-phosphate acyltransferase
MIPQPRTPLAALDRYATDAGRGPGPLARALPSLMFYQRMVRSVLWSARRAKRGTYDDRAWEDSSFAILDALERVGVRFAIEGMRHITAFEGPAVFAGNHMSTLETFVLPILISPVKSVTFVIKPSLIEYPVFKHVMRSRDPIVVSRDNPRQDLVTVLEEGKRRLLSGRSIILFPQTTRSTAFDPAQFNTLGVKLARSAGVPVVPFALDTRAWGNGRQLKDYGPIRPDLPVHIAFDAPLRIEGAGRAEHDTMVQFIEGALRAWGVTVQSSAA